MSPEEIKQLRKDLKLSARELATNIKAETEDVWAWETGERFPTKRFVTRMLALRKKGVAKQPPPALVKPAAGAAASPLTGLARLSDPELWTLVRKLAQHPAFFDRVLTLAKEYPDPATPATPAVSAAPVAPATPTGDADD